MYSHYYINTNSHHCVIMIIITVIMTSPFLICEMKDYFQSWSSMTWINGMKPSSLNHTQFINSWLHHWDKTQKQMSLIHTEMIFQYLFLRAIQENREWWWDHVEHIRWYLQWDFIQGCYRAGRMEGRVGAVMRVWGPEEGERLSQSNGHLHRRERLIDS